MNYEKCHKEIQHIIGFVFGPLWIWYIEDYCEEGCENYCRISHDVEF
jgi:hypothetical protein